MNRAVVNVLLIEDDKEQAKEYVAMLALSPIFEYSVVFAGTYEEASRVIGERKFDMILLDLVLPNGIGIALVRLLVKLMAQVSMAAPVVVITGLLSERIMLDILREGVVSEVVFKDEIKTSQDLLWIVQRAQVRYDATCITKKLRDCAKKQNECLVELTTVTSEVERATGDSWKQGN